MNDDIVLKFDDLKVLENAFVGITLNVEDAKIVDEYIFKKACRLKDAGLEDSKCYPALMRAHNELQRMLKEIENERKRIRRED